MSAIHISTSWLLELNSPGKAVVLTDSRTSLFLINHGIPKKNIHSTSKIHDNIVALADGGWDLLFQWIPSHCDILGNDTVDTLANEGRLLYDITYPLELCELKNNIKKQMLWMWQHYWNIEKQNSNYGLLKPNIRNWSWCRSNSSHNNQAQNVKNSA